MALPTTMRSWPSGGGKTGELIRTHDWATTPLGPIEAWPQSLRTIVDITLASPYRMIFVWGPSLVMLYNDAYRPLLGGKHPHALGQPLHVAWSEVWDDVRPMFQQVLTTGASVTLEDTQYIIERSGFAEEIYISSAVHPLYDETGNVMGVMLPHMDTTRRVLAERRIATLSALGAEHAATTVGQACDRALGALATNPADLPFALLYLLDETGTTAHLAGSVGFADREEGATRAICPAIIDLAEEADQQTRQWPLAQAMRREQPIGVDDLAAHFDADVPFPGGAWPEPARQALVLPLAAPMSPRPAGFLVLGASPRLPFDDAYREFFTLAAGQIAASLANAQGLEAERARVEALAALDHAKTAFFSNISHEFRTPLTLILGPLEQALAGADGEVPAPLREDLTVAHRNAQRMLKLVNTLLDFSRIEAGRITASYEPVDLAALTTDLASVFRSAIERAGLILRVECPPLERPVYVDREMWEKVVLNLLSNAFKFTFAGEIAVTLHAQGEAVALRVSDTGTGIPAAEVPHIFERFHRVQGGRSRTHEGSGIGLALVQELVRLQGGTITVTSVVNEGTTFTVSLPFGSAHLPPERLAAPRAHAATATDAAIYVEEALRWLPDDTLSPSPDVAAPRAPQPAWLGPPSAPHWEDVPRIVLAEDNADMRDYLKRLLSGPYHVEAVGDGAAALEAVQAQVPDLVLADVMMPYMDGLHLLRSLRADPATREIPLILLSARAGEEAHVAGLAEGADDYIIKPFTARELQARVWAHLQLARERRRSAQQVRALSRRLLEVQEEERRWLAFELHDEIGQVLTGVQLSLRTLRGKGAEERDTALSELEAQVQRLTEQVRQLSGDLRPTTLEHLGLLPALTELIQRVAMSTGVQVTLHHEGMDQRFPRPVEITAYRIVQEALTNVAKHAATAAATVQVLGERGRLTVLIGDEGRGFAPDQVAHSGGLGSMRERVGLLGGHLEIASAPGEGTRVLAELPALEADEFPPEGVRQDRRSSASDRP